jgi:predicted  nucleic acid-binding Zn-ribbon protein
VAGIGDGVMADINLMVTIGGFVVMLVTLGIGYGQLKGEVKKHAEELKRQEEKSGAFATRDELKILTDRAEEDRRHDNERIRELYQSRNGTERDMEEVKTLIIEVKSQMGEFKTEVRRDINGLGEKFDRMRERTGGMR